MKKKSDTPASDSNEGQSNIGYENTKTRNDGDERETKRVQPAKTGHGEGPKKSDDDSGGLRSESGKKTQGKKDGSKKAE